MDNIYCNNCGSIGHISKNCRNPVTSYGVILFKIDEGIPNILMINRKDSLCYIDFLRGKYGINNYKYIQILIDKFSNNEKMNIIKYDFDTLWKKLWIIKAKEIKKTSDYLKGKEKFNKLKQGLFCEKLNKKICLEYFVENSKTNYENPEWEFPKGRRNESEKNKDCALRELKEETGYDKEDYELIINIKPFTENYIGENKIKYKHIYYIGKLINSEKKLEIDYNNQDQFLEVSDLRWFSLENSLNIIRNYHKTRKSIIENMFQLIKDLDKYLLI